MAQSGYSIPEHVKRYIKAQGYTLPCDPMEGYIQRWWGLFQAQGAFWDYEERDGNGNTYKLHRRTVKPAKRVCKEWASLMLNEQTVISTEDEACNDFIAETFQRLNFFPHGQDLLERAFGLGTAAWSMWLDTDTREMQIRRYDARMVVPLSWDDDGVSECAFATKVTEDGKDYDQLQMHMLEGGMYRIRTVYFDKDGELVSMDGVLDDYATGSADPWFAIVTPALANTVVDFSPYGMSLLEDAYDTLQSVDLCYDTMMGEMSLGKMRVFLSDVMFQVEDRNGTKRPIPFGKDDATMYRLMADTQGELIKEYAPSLRTESQVRAYRTALQAMGDACGFGKDYFDIDDAGGLRTATEVSADNSQLMRNIQKHENLLGGAIVRITRAMLQCARNLGVGLPDEGEITVKFDDSIITDTASEKRQDLSEVGVTMNAWEYRAKWYGEDEETAKANVPQQAAPYEPFDLGA